MTGSSLRSRLLLAFVGVTLAAVALVTAAALVGTSQGLSAQEAATRQGTADGVAAAAGAAYAHNDSWTGADLRPAQELATAAGAGLVVRDVGGAPVAGTTASPSGMGPGMGGMGSGTGGMGNGAGQGQGPGAAGRVVGAAVTAGGVVVGRVGLVFDTSTVTAGRPVAWAWVRVAAAAAVALAVGAAWIILRMLIRPLGRLTDTARAFAAGDRTARTHLDAPGELGELAAAFDDAAEQVAVSEHARRQMSADVAHELRTPLAALQAGLEELRDGLAPADPEALARLHDQSLRLGRVVDDLAALSAADAARLTLQPQALDLSIVAAEVIQDWTPRLRAVEITVESSVGEPAPCHGDAERLRQVVGNLLANCTRHCRPGDTVTVRTTTVDGTARLTVIDTGPGIAPADVPHVFTRFWRSGDGGGSGLGMPIVASIVEAHGGQVRVDSDGRSGTTVTVDLPGRPTRPGEAARPLRPKVAIPPGV